MNREEVGKLGEKLVKLSQGGFREFFGLEMNEPEMQAGLQGADEAGLLWSFEEAGFDITGMKPGAWEALMSRFSVRYVGTQRELHPDDEIYQRVGSDWVGAYVWDGHDVTIHTGNNPITGEFNTPSMREPEVDFASYIGIEGNPDVVGAVCRFILENAKYVKQFEPGVQSFV